MTLKWLFFLSSWWPWWRPWSPETFWQDDFPIFHRGWICGAKKSPKSLQKVSKKSRAPKKVSKKCSKLVFFWHPLGLTWGAACLAFSVQRGFDDVLLSHLATKGLKSIVLGRFWHSWGTSKTYNRHRFLCFDSVSSGPKAIVHFTLMHLRQQQITTCNVYTAIVLALHRLAAPRVPRTNLEF